MKRGHCRCGTGELSSSKPRRSFGLAMRLAPSRTIKRRSSKTQGSRNSTRGLAYAYKQLGRIPDALEEYDRAVNLTSSQPGAADVQTLRDRGFARRNQGDLDGALLDY